MAIPPPLVARTGPLGHPNPTKLAIFIIFITVTLLSF
jgi:hypothetical protein